ncbi:hypothetical protein, variant [Cryptococcus amylolentus CBS 6039]|uniref:Spo12 family protein n=1 Tax=Cryptococcus amylolentus CBS 6039 TaxID=1295533 RepID=A0A1E3HY60_9TREE|nr:hypothetical protein L202_02871 [Cryptococcus amylolentus CBS 6039]XP_018995272.1 hypothetical protein, variant [Cryptococcus amylolentus CBS 6039]ODN80705.1 hypothetical protein L202_02871 [Cryptococcus amylolentus CBS 6039]ODN80706.1 hypothetical protein, variant [Cryptococcus amylolentus CBS 6039]
MSPTATPVKDNNAPSPTITPLHDPSHQAKVIPQTKPLGASNPNIVPGMATDGAAPGLGHKALLSRKFAKANKPTISPTDQIQSPCTAKLTSAKQRHFTKGKPASLAQSFVAIRESSSASSPAPAGRKTDL